MAGDIDYFPDEEEARDFARFHGFAGEFARVDAAGGDFGFFVAFGACGSDGPVVNLLFERGERGIRPGGGGVELEPARGKAVRKERLKCFARGGFVARFCFADGSGGVEPGSEIDPDGLTFRPIRRNLQNGRAAKSAVGEEHFFAEFFLAKGNDDVGGNSCQFAAALAIGGMKDERNERGARRDNFQAELAGEVVAERGGAHLGDGQASRGDDQRGRAKFVGVGACDKFRGSADFLDLSVQTNPHVRGAAFLLQHSGDLGGRAIAKKLAERFLVIGDAVLLHQGDEIGGRVTRKTGLGKVGIGGDKIFRRAMNVGEVAATSPGNEDFLADAVGVFQDGDAAAALAGFDGAQ